MQLTQKSIEQAAQASLAGCHGMRTPASARRMSQPSLPKAEKGLAVSIDITVRSI